LNGDSWSIAIAPSDPLLAPSERLGRAEPSLLVVVLAPATLAVAVSGGDGSREGRKENVGRGQVKRSKQRGNGLVDGLYMPADCGLGSRGGNRNGNGVAVCALAGCGTNKGVGVGVLIPSLPLSLPCRSPGLARRCIPSPTLQNQTNPHLYYIHPHAGRNRKAIYKKE
jgi:hypothetical protein